MYSRDQTLGPRLLDFVKSIGGLAGIRDRARSFEVRGRNVDHQMEEIDLLQDNLFINVEIRREGPTVRVLDMEDAYRTIGEAFRDNGG